MVLIKSWLVRFSIALSCLSVPAAAQRLNRAEALTVYRPILVRIETQGSPDEPCHTMGSGFVVGQHDNRVYIITAQHVAAPDPQCEGHIQILARSALNPGLDIPLRLVRASDDMALLSADLSGFPTQDSSGHLCWAIWGQPATPVADLIFLGYFPPDLNPLPYDGHIETGIADNRQRIYGSVNHGLSGGPVIDLNGRIIGMVREVVTRDQSNNLVVGKGNITPVSILQSEIQQTPMEKVAREPCALMQAMGSPPTTLPQRITIPLQISEMNDDHPGVNLGDTLAWLGRAASGGSQAALRYPRSYERRFTPQQGYRFTTNFTTRVISHNTPSEPLPSAECPTPDDCIRVSEDGRQLTVRFRLWSGPITDQTRGWLDMVILSEQTRVD